VGNANPIRWQCQYFDIETGLYYSGSYYDPRLGQVLNATIEEAFAEGGYQHQSPNPYSIFPANVLSQPAWGYPKVHVADLEEQQQEAARQRRVRWWHWLGAALSGPFMPLTLPLLALHQNTNLINNDFAWGATNAMIAVGVTGSAVIAGAATGGALGVKLFGAAFGKALLTGGIAGGIVGGANLATTSIRTQGFTNMSGLDLFNVGFSGFSGGFSGAFGTGLASKWTGAGPMVFGAKTPLTTLLGIGGSNAALNLAFYTLGSALPGNSFTTAGMLMAVISGMTLGMNTEANYEALKALIEVLKNTK